jgi:hypothetical protein
MHCFVVMLSCGVHFLLLPNGCYLFKGKCLDEGVNEYSKRKCWSMTERSGIGLFGISGGVVCGGHKSTSGTQQFSVLGVHWISANEVCCNNLTILTVIVAGLWIGTIGGNKGRSGIPYRMW